MGLYNMMRTSASGMSAHGQSARHRRRQHRQLQHHWLQARADWSSAAGVIGNESYDCTGRVEPRMHADMASAGKAACWFRLPRPTWQIKARRIRSAKLGVVAIDGLDQALDGGPSCSCYQRHACRRSQRQKRVDSGAACPPLGTERIRRSGFGRRQTLPKSARAMNFCQRTL